MIKSIFEINNYHLNLNFDILFLSYFGFQIFYFLINKSSSRRIYLLCV